MRRAIRTVWAVLLCLTLLLPAGVVARDIPAPTPPADGEVALVVDVTDGDTIRVDRGDGGSERLRYIGIDTPETFHRHEPVEPWGPEALAANEVLVAGQVVLLERDVSDRDKYDRLLRYVWVETPDGWVMVNAALVAAGLADVHAYGPDTRHHDYLREVEYEALEAGVGMHGPADGVGEVRQCYIGGIVVESCHLAEEDDEDEEKSAVDQIIDFFFGG